MRKQFTFLLLIFLFVISTGCRDGEVRLNNYVVNQMQVSVQTDQIQLTEKDVWKPVPLTFVLMNITETSDFNCLFVAETRGAANVIGKLPEKPSIVTFPLEVRILVDGEVANPNKATFTPGYTIIGKIPYLSSHSFLAVVKDVSPGSHSIVVQWKGIDLVEGGSDYFPSMGNRTLTVWQSVKREIKATHKVVNVEVPSDSLSNQP